MVCCSEKPSGTARAFWNVPLLPQTQIFAPEIKPKKLWFPPSVCDRHCKGNWLTAAVSERRRKCAVSSQSQSQLNLTFPSVNFVTYRGACLPNASYSHGFRKCYLQLSELVKKLKRFFFQRSRAWILKSKKSKIKKLKIQKQQYVISEREGTCWRKASLAQCLSSVPVLRKGAGTGATLFLFVHWFS